MASEALKQIESNDPVLKLNQMDDSSVGSALDSGGINFYVQPNVQYETLGAAGSPEPVRPIVVLIGHLRNPSNKSLQVLLLPVGRTGFKGLKDTPFVVSLTESKEIKDKTPSIPPEPPLRVSINIPARSEVIFRSSIDTLHLEYRGEPVVEVQWQFIFGSKASEIPNGKLRAKLPKRV